MGKRIGLWYLATMVWSGIFLAIQLVTKLSFDAITLAQFGPMLGTITMLMWRPDVYRPINAGDFSVTGKVVVRSVIAAALVAASFALMALLTQGDIFTMLKDSTLEVPILVTAVLWFFGCIGEEYGWRTYLQRDLEQKYALPAAAGIVGCLWAVYHTAIIFEGPVVFGLFLWTCIALSITMAVLIAGMGKRVIWVAAIFHYVTNMLLLVYFNNEAVNSTDTIAVQVSITIIAAIALTTWYLRPQLFGRDEGVIAS